MSNKASRDEVVQFRLWRYLDHTRYMIFRLREKELAQVGLTPEQAHILDILQSAGGSTSINSIVKATQRQHNSMSTLVARMTKQGLVRKTRTRRDKRAYRIAITEKGEAVYQKIPRESVNQAFAILSLEEKEKLLSLMEQVLSHVYELHGTQFESGFLIEERQHTPESSG
jgi:DNA-binding MarR family transcriptional regulator